MRFLEQDDIPAAVEILAEASVNDPYWVYLIQDPTKRFHFMRKYLRVNLRVEWTRGHLLGIGNPLEGIAVWKPPESPPAARIPILFATLSYLRLLSPFVIGLTLKVIRVFRRYSLWRTRNATPPYYHLVLLGVRPSSQGKGYASGLIRPILKRADFEGTGAYVETTNPDNVPFYEHFGFELKGEFLVPKSSLRGWGFYRSPK
ncbi:MAG: GNAT family N-acetyltransferase [Candidatus Thorarchaeota archaeon]|jgi:GNAT superfamily N-acetyltransferase